MFDLSPNSHPPHYSPQNNIVLHCVRASTTTFQINPRYGCHTVCKIILNYYVNDGILSSTTWRFFAWVISCFLLELVLASYSWLQKFAQLALCQVRWCWWSEDDGDCSLQMPFSKKVVYYTIHWIILLEDIDLLILLPLVLILLWRWHSSASITLFCSLLYFMHQAIPHIMRQVRNIRWRPTRNSTSMIKFKPSSILFAGL